VFLAQQDDLANRPVVLKVSHHITGEEISLAQLQHTNIVPVYSVHRAGPLHAICMPYFGATTFADVVRELQARESPPDSARWLIELVRRRRGTENPVSETALLDLELRSYIDAILVLAAQLAEALGYAHDRGIVHRDLKPGNVLLSDEGRPMILDFNLSDDAGRASSGFDGGTVAYMAPECIESFRDGDFRADACSDLYALGLVLYELLCGTPPFPIVEGEGPGQRDLDRLIRERRGPLPDPRTRNGAISPAVASILGRCLEPDPARRYRSADELREDLERQLSDRPLRFAPEPSLRERASKWIRRHPRLTSSYAVGIFAATLLLVLGLLYARRGYQLALVEAAHNYQQFRDEVETGRFLAAAPLLHPKERTEGLAKIRRAAGRFHVLERRDWSSTPEYRMLSPEDQAEVRRGLVLSLLYLADEEDDLTAVVPDAKKAAHYAEALRLNDLARQCSPNQEGQSAISFQRSRLQRPAGDPSPEEDVDLPDKAKAHYELYLAAHGGMTLGEYRKAAEMLRQAIRHNPQDPFLYYVLGNCELVLGRPEQAIYRLDTSIALRPRFYWTFFLRAGAKAEQKDHEAALEDFDEAIRLRPDFLPAYADRALSRAALGDYGGALADLTHAIDGGYSARLFFLRAKFRHETGDWSAAVCDYLEGLTRRPDDEQGWVARGFERARFSPGDAVGDFDEALKLNSRSIPALEAKANVLSELLGRTEEAIGVLDVAVEAHPDYPSFRSGRGVLWARLGRRPEAIGDARESLRLEHPPEVTYQVAGIYALTSRQDPADRAEAFRLLQAAFQQGYGLDLIDRDPELVPIRELPEFRRLVDAARAQRFEVPRPSP
jgi:tetratricopeptide (TPR) repeat protein